MEGLRVAACGGGGMRCVHARPGDASVSTAADRSTRLLGGENAWLEARSPGTATIFVDEYGPAGVVRSVAASVTIAARVD